MITVNDLKFLASQRLNDEPDGGGLSTGTAIQDGVENNLFPDIGTLDRANGRLQLRKVYPSVLSLNTDTYIGAHVIFDDGPNDPNVDVFMMQYGNLTTERAVVDGFISSLSATGSTALTVSGRVVDQGTYALGELRLADNLYEANINTIRVGSRVSIRFPAHPTDPAKYWVAIITSIGVEPSTPNTRRISFRIPEDLGLTVVTNGYLETYPDSMLTSASGGASLHGVSAISAASAGATSITVTNPKVNTTYGQDVQVFHPYVPVVIHETFSAAPANVGTGTINTGKTNLSRVRIIDNDGDVIGRYDIGAVQPTGTGASVNFATGVITVTSTAGWAQPVIVEHRIEDMRVPQSFNAETGVMTLNRALAHAFTTNAKVSSMLVYGDLFAQVHDGFAQTAWNGLWADNPQGAQPLADFNHVVYPITSSNRGSITERWAAIFTNSQTFYIVGEQVGVILTGALITEDCAPINPSTLTPYFTIPKEGWGSLWAGGNVYRFNTDGANFPIWVGRSIQPSDPFGTDSATLQLRGDIDA